MTTQTAKPQTLFPDLPREAKVLDPDGTWTQVHQAFFDRLVTTLQQNFKNEGILFPSLTAAQISTIQGFYTPYIGNPLPQNQAGGTGKFLADISGQTVFDSTNRVPKQFIITYDGSTPPNITAAQWYTFTLT